VEAERQLESCLMTDYQYVLDRDVDKFTNNGWELARPYPVMMLGGFTGYLMRREKFGTA